MFIIAFQIVIFPAILSNISNIFIDLSLLCGDRTEGGRGLFASPAKSPRPPKACLPNSRYCFKHLFMVR
jgi:hypothetical protein